jgi:hypothetical protein
VIWPLSVAVTGGILILTAVFGRSDRYLWFWFLSTLLAILPISAGNPLERTMLLVSFGGAGMVTRLMELIWSTINRPELERRPHRFVRGLGATVCIYLLTVHTVAASVLFPFRILIFEQHRTTIETAALSLDDVGPLNGRDLIIVNPPDCMFTWHLSKIRSHYGRPNAEHMRILCTGLTSLELERPDDNTLIFRPGGPFVKTGLSDIYRNSPFEAGWHRELSGVTVDVTQVTAGGDAEEVIFSFDKPLESDDLVWVEWKEGRYVPFTLPATGTSISIPAQVTNFWTIEQAFQKLFGS